MQKKATKKLKMTVNEKTFEEGFEEFIVSCRVKNLSEVTIKGYKNEVYYSFGKFFDTTQPISCISSSLVDKYILYLQERGLKDVTVNTHIRELRSILYYFMEHGWLKSFKMKLAKAESPIIETYSDSELRLLLEKPNMKKCTFAEYRNWVVCNFLIATGCRSNTLLNIQTDDIDFENEVVIYKKTKNKKQQVIPLTKSLIPILREYIQRIEEGYLFTNSFGEPMTNSTLGHNLRSYNLKRGVSTTGVHRFRHTFAKKFLLNGGDVFRLQKLLGHSDMSVVKNYVNMFTDDLKQDFDKFNPLESVMIKNTKIKLNQKK